MSQPLSLSQPQDGAPTVQFCPPAEAAALGRTGRVLGVLGFGAGRPSELPAAIPFAAPEMDLLGGEPLCEVWLAPAPVAYGEVAGGSAAWSQGLFFSIQSSDPSAPQSLEAATFEMYDRLFSALESAGFRHLLRIWNYFSDITKVERQLERYQHFSVARHQAFLRHQRAVESAPAASAVGSHGGPLIVISIASRTPGVPIENPRQISAYHYPERYGPKSPIFSRALLAGAPGETRLFFSGTASIVGHESVHLGDPAAQADEAMENLKTLQDVAAASGFIGSKRLLKAYVRDPRTLPAIESRIAARLGPGDGVVYLKGELCRSELLVEIEGVCS